MIKRPLPELQTLYLQAFGYTKHASMGHELGHFMGGLPGGLDLRQADPQGYMDYWAWPVTAPEYQAILKDRDKRQKLFSSSTRDPAFIQNLHGKRNETIVGFLENQRLLWGVRQGYLEKTLTTENSTYIDVPFFTDELGVAQIRSYLHIKTFCDLHQYFFQPENDDEIDTLFSQSCAFFQDSDFQCSRSYDAAPYTVKILYDIMPDDVEVNANLSMADEDYFLGTTRPLVISKPEPHFVFGSSLRIALAKVPQQAGSFDMAMTRYYQEQHDAVFIHDADRHLQRYLTGTPYPVATPYQQECYETAIGPYQLYAVNRSNIIKSCSIPCSDFIERYQDNSPKLAKEIQSRLAF